MKHIIEALPNSNENTWDNRLEFLLNIRKGWCNTDYIEFLINKVWKIQSPINIIDFGCGYGYICSLFMPLLPEGSTYTGIDNSKVLLEEAEKNFKNCPFTTRFICEDLCTYIPIEKYDVAISQAVLRHIPNPKNILKKMIDSVIEDGMVICMEGDRPIEDSGFYCSEIDYLQLGQNELYKKLWKYELDSGGRDYRTGIKIPQFMQELGLKNVGSRMNDSVKFVNPHSDQYDDEFNAYIKYKGYDRVITEDKEIIINAMMNKGLTKIEAEKYVDNELQIAHAILDNKGEGYIVQAPCILISYGIK